ncbi:hypothetical protein GCM10011507_04630 [Edaphobacter acidisoli]|uniref:Flagellar protein FliL n=2 Tax=Edaphobacter acidisoli TaxID=2040573 RepID=A0A916RG28_9BACT|nr:flagellar basal body-associated FliL family protein [Edaphobacter acidisoli]GGA56392.1 hypothetical protein GCM10011507_04630 [Edaphobacter acidisoli]
MGPLLIAVISGIVIATLALGSVAYWLLRSGRLPMQGKASVRQEQVAPTPTHVVALDPLVVNLADAGGNAYLRVTMALRVEDVTGKKGASESNEKSGDANASGSVAEVRDTALTVLGQQTSTELLAPGGKEHLKSQLKAALAAHDPDLKVVDIFFTDFLVQQ